MGDRYVESEENAKPLYNDAKILYGLAMSQPLSSGIFEKLDSSQITTKGNHRRFFIHT